MEQLDSRSFTHNGNTFELKLYGTNSGFSVVAFLGDKQVSPKYSVDFDTYQDHFMQYQQKLTDSLFGIARSDIEHHMYFKG